MSMTTESVETSTETHLVGGLALLPRVNLLPPEIAERRQFRRVQFGLGGAVAASALLLGFLVVAAGNGVTEANDELAGARTENQKLVKQTASYQNVKAIYAAAAASEAQLSTAMGDEIRFSQMLNDFSLAIPSTVWMGSLQITTTPPASTAAGQVGPAQGVGSVTVAGSGFSHNDVAVWLEAIAGLKGFSDPYFASSTEARIGARKIVNFTSTATINSSALSGRYTKPMGG